MLQLCLIKKERELVRRVDVDGLIDQIAGVTLTDEPARAVRAAWRSCDPAKYRARGVRGAGRNRQGLPTDGRQVRRATAR